MAAVNTMTLAFGDASTGFTGTVTVTENADGTLTFVLDVDESGGSTGDVRALYLNLNGEDQIDGLSVSTAEGSDAIIGEGELVQNIDKVRSVEEKDTNVNGEVLKENDGAFDVGIEFGSSGIGEDDVQHMEFTLSADEYLTLDSFDFETIGLRATSVGDVDGSRDDSLKLTGDEVTPDDAPPPEPEGDLTADSELALVNGETLFGGLDAQPLAVDPRDGDAYDTNVLVGDLGTDSFAITSIFVGEEVVSTAIDGDGWFEWIDAEGGGEVRVNVDGSFEFRADERLDLELLADGDRSSIMYQITDINGLTAEAELAIEIIPFSGVGDDIFSD